MRKEFWFWVVSSIENMAVSHNRPLSVDQRRDLLNIIKDFSDDDYENVSNGLMSTIEDRLVLYGFSKNEAIRMSWKWSD